MTPKITERLQERPTIEILNLDTAATTKLRNTTLSLRKCITLPRFIHFSAFWKRMWKCITLYTRTESYFSTMSTRPCYFSTSSAFFGLDVEKCHNYGCAHAHSSVPCPLFRYYRLQEFVFKMCLRSTKNYWCGYEYANVHLCGEGHQKKKGGFLPCLRGRERGVLTVVYWLGVFVASANYE